MSKHTPGPWRISIGGTISNQIEAFCGKKLDNLDDGYRAVASYHHCEPTGLYANERANAEANARLIAAAPDLLEACEHALTLLDPFEDDGLSLGLGGQALKEIRAAVAKARGAGQ